MNIVLGTASKLELLSAIEIIEKELKDSLRINQTVFYLKPGTTTGELIEAEIKEIREFGLSVKIKNETSANKYTDIAVSDVIFDTTIKIGSRVQLYMPFKVQKYFESNSSDIYGTPGSTYCIQRQMYDMWDCAKDDSEYEITDISLATDGALRYTLKDCEWVWKRELLILL